MSNRETPLQLIQETSLVLGKVLRSMPIAELELELERSLNLVKRLRQEIPEIEKRSLSQIWWEFGVPVMENK